ncbi:hypothetical protein [Fulvivirga lutimaris]|uniref:hypothetical protein n=1 Tax=Fulvivirga lutimaris TaxID=1819566 RepID=UPI0012BB57AB|nr:hypothetical protein [Fulvivirga lutimaris]MTI41450.1 hypothetical protein [Fulvivirga lutimaris]
MKVEVFKTNIKTPQSANIITGLMHLCFPAISANVDLDDSDHVLRVASENNEIDETLLINFVRNLGFQINRLN